MKELINELEKMDNEVAVAITKCEDTHEPEDASRVVKSIREFNTKRAEVLSAVKAEAKEHNIEFRYTTPCEPYYVNGRQFWYWRDAVNEVKNLMEV